MNIWDYLPFESRFARMESRIGSVKNHMPLLLVAATLLVVGCGDGDSGDTSPFDDGGGTSQPGIPSGGELNGGLTGRIITTQDGFPIEFDLRTGQSRVIPLDPLQRSLEATGETIAVNEEFYFTGTRNGDFLQAGAECFEAEFLSGLDDESCYALFDASFSRIDFVALRNVSIRGPVRISDSGRFLAYSETVRLQGGGGRSDTIVQDLVTLQNVQTFERQDLFRSTFPPVFAWGQNGDFVFTGGGNTSVFSDDTEVAFIEIANENNLGQTRVITLPETPLYFNRISAIDLNPAGDRIVFVIDATVLILDLNTLLITQPVIAPRLGGLRQARWSPDGSMIMVMRQTIVPPPDFDAFGNPIVFQNNESLFAISADVTEPVDIDDESSDDFILILSERLDQPGEFTSRYPGDSLFQNPTYDWLPE